MSKKPKPDASDIENPEWRAETFARAKPAHEVLPEILNHELAAQLLKPRGRPRLDHPKERISIRLSHEVLDHFRSAGDGWQTRIDTALKQYIREHS